MKKYNIPLIIGSIIIILLMFIVVFKNDLIKTDPYSIEIGNYEIVDGEWIYNERPAPPSETHPFGTDVLGRDIYSQVIFGASITLKVVFLTILFRFMLAVPFGMLAGFGSKISQKIIQIFSITFSAIPALLLSIIILGQYNIVMLELNKSIMIFAIVLSFVGWGRLAHTIQGHTNEILQRDFIQGEIAIGKSQVMIAIQNILPHLVATIIVLFFLEIGNVLLMIAELGVFGIFVGKPTINAEALNMLGLGGAVRPSSHPEWGGMIASARYAITARKYWLIIYPAIAFFISILGFNLFGEGIKYEIEKRDSKVITWIKRVLSQFSIKTYIYEIKNFREYKRNIIIKTSIILLLLLIPFVPAPKSKYQINGDELWKNVNELSMDKYSGREVGSEESRLTIEYIENEFKKLSIKPLFNDSYTKSKTVKNKNILSILNGEIKISGDDNNTFILGQDFNSNGLYYENRLHRELYIYDNIVGEIVTVDQFLNKEFKTTNEFKFVIVDQNKHSSDILQKVFNSSNTLVFILGEDEDIVKFPNKIYDVNPRFRALGVLISSKVFDEMNSNLNNECTISWDVVKKTEYNIVNIGGVIEGKSSENPILLTTNYDFYGDKRKGIYDNVTSIATILEIGTVLSKIDEKPDQTIIIAFTDASKLEMDGAKYLTLNEYVDDETFYFKVNYLGLKDSPQLCFDNAYLASETFSSADLLKYIEKRSSQLGLKSQRDTFSQYTEEAYIYSSRGSSGMVFKGIVASDLQKYEYISQDDLTEIDQNILEKQAQTILDVLINISYE